MQQKIRTSLWLILLFSASLAAQSQLPFEADIRAFERLDSLERQAKGQILLYGSSTMRMWTTYKTDLDGYQVVNRGFGGSQMSDAVYYFDRVVVPLAPTLILLYEGDNDLSNGKKTPEQVYADFQQFMQLIKQKLPNTRVAIYSLRPSLARENLMPQQRQLNDLFRKYCKKHRKKVFYIDAYDLLLTPAGKPNGDLLATDKLHLNTKGYALWTQVTRAFLKSKMPVRFR